MKKDSKLKTGVIKGAHNPSALATAIGIANYGAKGRKKLAKKGKLRYGE